MDHLEENSYFASPVYMVRKPEFLETVRAVSNRYLNQIGSPEIKHPFNKDLTRMTASYHAEPELVEFAQYVSQTAWNILASQGYAMESLATFFMEMWTQEHKYLSSMDTHVHGHGSQITAFYILDIPKDGCKFIIHDPRQTKTIVGLPEMKDEMITPASNQIVFTLEEGILILTNSWLPHSFTKNFSLENTRFVHMNLGVTAAPQPSVEVI